MIINVSGRTDIVAFYMEWFLNRIKEGYFLIRNPFYEKLIHKIDYEDIDMFVFCTKDPKNLLKNLDKIDKPFIVHITLTPYGKDIEPNVPNKQSTIEIIKKLSKILGKNRIFVRYDPIFLSEKYSIEYHIQAFEEMTNSLNGYTNSIIVSFMDEYKNVLKNKDVLKYRSICDKDLEILGLAFSSIASKNNMTVSTCGENRTLFEYGFINQECISKELVYEITGKEITEKWKGRKNKYCNCVHMYDIGMYNSCKHLCKYCYANYNEKEIEYNIENHNPNSPLIKGELKNDDIVKLIKKGSD